MISIESLRVPNKQRKVAFSNVIRTDGFAADVILTKKINTVHDEYFDYLDDIDISLLGEVISSDEVKDMSLCGVDPNRGQVFAASFGEGENSHQLRRCSTKEYYTYTGSLRHVKRERKRMNNENMEDIFLNIPTAKTAIASTYLQYVVYILLHLNKILSFNGFSTATSRFHLYQGVQRAREEMVNILVNGGKKYNKLKRKNLKKNRKKRRKKRKDNKKPIVKQM